MHRIRSIIFLLFVLLFQKHDAQSIEIFGKVESDVNVENIHVINKTSHSYSITNRLGEFHIKAALNDTLLFTSVQHKSKEILVIKNIITTRLLIVHLEEQINELDEVRVGKVLSGNLLSDIKNIAGKAPINFYDVGITGYKGRIATQSERRLAEAGDFKPKMLLGLLTGGIPLNPILNGLSGRTKMLKTRVNIEQREALMQKIKVRLSKDFFASNPLNETLKMDFFYFCSDDKSFINHCENQTDFKILIFLRMKYKQYLENLENVKD